MPQGREKKNWEAAEFIVMLRNINLLYLFCSVLILQDRSYMSRFWVTAESGDRTQIFPTSDRRLERSICVADPIRGLPEHA